MRVISVIKHHGGTDGRDGDAVKVREVTDECRKGKWMDHDTLQHQACNISGNRADVMSHQRRVEDGCVPPHNPQRPEPRKGLEMGSGIKKDRRPNPFSSIGPI